MLVAVALFSVVVLVSVSALLSVVDANRKAQSLHSVMNNLNFALENMSRHIRTGRNYRCGSTANIETPQDCPNGDTVFAFEASDGTSGDTNDQVVYRYTDTYIERSTDGGSSYQRITAPEVTIDELSFYVVGTARGDTEQPRVTMVVRGTAGSNELATDFNVQTTVSQRLFDL